ncbi:hypothetical protein [Kitasatospora sp. MBT66]|uniref:hypothetical protein n=1 Tax=Kitasatospora sp. MBT66 TaxID=1444769 RepID=UPI000A541940|nr:hypothetical protein [Kitasatospora sp. MBT66]
MSTTLPRPSSPDRSMAVPHAVVPTTTRSPLDEPTRPGLNGGTITLYALAAFFALFGLVSLVKNTEADLGGYDAAYRAGHHYGAFVLSLPFLVVALILHAASRAGLRPSLNEGRSGR